MTTTNETYPWSFITTQNTWYNYDYDKRNISMIIHYHTEYLVQPWLQQTEHVHDHSLPHILIGSNMTMTNGAYPWSFITTHNTWFNHEYDKRTYPWSFITTHNTWFNHEYDKWSICMIIHYHTEYLLHLWLRQMKHIHDHSSSHIILDSTMNTTNRTYPWSFITTHNTWFNYDYYKRNISMIMHYHT